MRHQSLVLGLFFAGVVIGLIGNVAAMVWRKAGIDMAALFWAGSNLAAYPERYVRSERVPVIRTIYILGVLLVVIAVGFLVLASLGIIE